MVQKVYFYCDESGAKGYADQDEAWPGEVGLFAGIMVAAEQFSAVSAKFNAIAGKYKPATGKLHIADLDDASKEALRTDIYQALRDSSLPCFWYAIHTAGLHADFKVKQEIHARTRQALQEARGGADPRVKVGSPREEPQSMHIVLFAGLYSHVVAFLMERGKNEVEIEVRTDQVDSPVLKQFVKVAEGLLDDSPDVSIQTGFDTATKTIVHSELSVGVIYPPNSPVLPTVTKLSIDTVPAEDGLVLAADVLANSLNYHFKQRSGNDLYAPLNRLDAVSSHPLSAQLDAFRDWGGADLVGDGIYRHPRTDDSH